MGNKKKIWLMMAFIFILAIATACSSAESGQTEGDQGNEANEDAITLNVLTSLVGEQPLSAVYEPGFETFNAEHDDINLNINTAAGNSIREKLLAEMAANNPPDVFFHWGTRRTENYIESDKIADLTELIEEDGLADQYVEDAFNPVEYQGGTYGLPISSYMYYFMVNKQLFEEHGVEIPSTYDELVTAVEQFKEAGLIPMAANNHSARYMMLTWLSQKKTIDSIIPNTTGEEPFGDALLEASEKAAELQQLGAFPDGKETLSTSQSLELFNTGVSPMFYQHSWTIGAINPDIVDQLEVVPFPLGDGESKNTAISGAGFFVYMSQQAYDDPEKREAAWELMKYLASPELGKQVIEKASDFSPLDVDYDVSEANEILRQAIEIRDRADNIVPSLDEALFSQGVQDNYWTLTDELSLQEMTPEEYVEAMNELVEEHPSKQFE
ncbi:extracellular solute-binding protein [Aquibacillus koreensis]|uniref:Extracellular solute-binding protein n=1 Tax=Aquibacillus koreensis TaxID=279446 RepID=A0A9X3WSN6_9BACI|nr:extracellular solute-binding protein [Aquibacillus koreensis]MCT2536676.1 extracellular solute-binding protein [Aquibacillus koreensis]MDC3422629.1 extracellular solute-binding protein [Aquibacillus koreensis]